MNNDWQWFKNPETGKEALLPARFGKRDNLVPVGGAECTDCIHQEPEPESEVIDIPLPSGLFGESSDVDPWTENDEDN